MGIKEFLIENNAHKIGFAKAKDVICDRGFRKACESNACGLYNRCHTCPPCIGDIDVLMSRINKYEDVLVYQTVGEIEDSYDIEGMFEVGDRHRELDLKANEFMKNNYNKDSFLHLGAGGCKICKKCSKIDNEPCRFPDKAMSPLEAYGVSVSQLAEISGLKYINGENTVTYFGAIFFK